jgi:hypothetical protein
MPNFVNAYQSPDDRRTKYLMLKNFGVSAEWARRARDFTWPKVLRFVEIQWPIINSARRQSR